jgi:hypothetical protein
MLEPAPRGPSNDTRRNVSRETTHRSTLRGHCQKGTGHRVASVLAQQRAGWGTPLNHVEPQRRSHRPAPHGRAVNREQPTRGPPIGPAASQLLSAGCTSQGYVLRDKAEHGIRCTSSSRLLYVRVAASGSPIADIGFTGPQEGYESDVPSSQRWAADAHARRLCSRRAAGAEATPSLCWPIGHRRPLAGVAVVAAAELASRLTNRRASGCHVSRETSAERESDCADVQPSVVGMHANFVRPYEAHARRPLAVAGAP